MLHDNLIVVLDLDILEDILREQRELSKDDGIADEMAILHQMAAAVLKQNQKEARQA